MSKGNKKENSPEQTPVLKQVTELLGKEVDKYAVLAKELRKAEELNKKSPPGMKDVPEALKDKGYSPESAFKIAWSQYNKTHEKPTKKNETMGYGNDDMMMAEKCPYCDEKNCDCDKLDKFAKSEADMIDPVVDCSEKLPANLKKAGFSLYIKEGLFKSIVLSTKEGAPIAYGKLDVTNQNYIPTDDDKLDSHPFIHAFLDDVLLNHVKMEKSEPNTFRDMRDWKGTLPNEKPAKVLDTPAEGEGEKVKGLTKDELKPGHKLPASPGVVATKGPVAGGLPKPAKVKQTMVERVASRVPAPATFKAEPSPAEKEADKLPDYGKKAKKRLPRRPVKAANKK